MQASDLASRGDDPDIISQLNRLRLDEIVGWFQMQGFVIFTPEIFQGTPFNNLIYIIYYKDSTQLWTKWARQARGIVVYYDSSSSFDSPKWRIIKMALRRGAEVLTGLHLKQNIASSDKISSFDANQRRVMMAMQKNEQLGGYLSMKTDGMLISITIYSGELARMLRDVINNSNNIIAKTVMELSPDPNLLPVISTQRTFAIDGEKKSSIFGYVVTSLLSDQKFDEQTDPLVFFSKHSRSFFDRLYRLYYSLEEIKIDDWLTISMECVCANRTCLWNIEHTELTINYPSSFFNIIAFTSGDKVYPHFLFSQQIKLVEFSEPIFWKLGGDININNMISDLSNIIYGKMNQGEFLMRYPPMGSGNGYLDLEGFIYYNELGGSEIGRFPTLDYHKVKTLEYYISHKPKSFKQLFEIARVSDAFPNATKVYLNFQLMLEALGSVRMRLIDLLNLNGNNSLDHQQLINLLPEKMLRVYRSEGIPMRKKCMMIISNDIFGAYIKDIFSDMFPLLINVEFDTQIYKLLRNIIAELAPYDDLKTDFLVEVPKIFEVFYQMLQDLSVVTRKYNKIEFERWYIIGCPHSTDIDIICSVSKREHVFLNVNQFNVEKLKVELSEFGYDVINRELDICVVFMNDNVIDVTSKGEDETQNILFFTYQYHKQKYPQPIYTHNKLSLENKCRVVGKYFLDNLKPLIGNEEYAKIRTERMTAYQGDWNRVIFAEKYLHLIKIDEKNRDDIKSLVMKIIQLILLNYDIYEYNKEFMAIHLSKLINIDPNTLFYLLFRGKKGFYDSSTLQILIEQFISISSSINLSILEWKECFLQYINTTSLSDALFTEFIHSPFEATDVFVEGILQICPAKEGLGDLFLIKSFNYHLLPKEILDRCIIADQRSDEWKHALEFYKCGQNTGIQECQPGVSWPAFYYNLIRGSIIENIVVSTINLTQIFPGKNVTKISIGLIVQTLNQKHSPGKAPDLLLMINGDDNSPSEIIPVEIKCLASQPVDNSSYRRAVSLASRQLESTIEIINHPSCHRGLIIFVYIFKNETNQTIYISKYTFWLRK